jgi:hypothetical protein
MLFAWFRRDKASKPLFHLQRGVTGTPLAHFVRNRIAIVDADEAEKRGWHRKGRWTRKKASGTSPLVLLAPVLWGSEGLERQQQRFLI